MSALVVRCGHAEQHAVGKPRDVLACPRRFLGCHAVALRQLLRGLVQRAAEEYKPLLERLKTVLGEQVREVRLTNRLIDSPACLVVDTHEFGLGLQRLLKAAGQSLGETRPILELNPEHVLVRRLREEADDDRFRDRALVLFDQALLAEGAQLDDPAAYVRRVNRLLSGA